MLFLGITLMVGPALRVSAQESPDETAVRNVVGEYVAAWRAGDAARLGEVFELDHGYVIWRQEEGGEATVRSKTFGELLEKRKPNPGYGEPYEILTLDVRGGEIAFVTFRAELAERGSYVNHFTLHKVADKWRITTKTFVWQEQ